MEKGTIYFVAAVLLILTAGFAGYYFGFLGFIYNVMLPNALANYNLIALSIIFGIAAFFSPCAFTMLPAFVANYLTKEEKEGRLAKTLYLGLMSALGIITVNVIIGAVIGLLGAAAPFAKDPREDIAPILAVRAVMGALVTILGFFTLTGRTIPLHFIETYLAKQSFSRSMYFYGVMYNAAAIGCTGPILLGLMLYAFAGGSFIFAITAFAAFSLTMGVLMVLLI
ncbi:MAG: hypothetical protein MN733_34925, partial [Nitrososphaera sp.]|nr:hypothetical protein [Nitrososphaera sp.]